LGSTLEQEAHHSQQLLPLTNIVFSIVESSPLDNDAVDRCMISDHTNESSALLSSDLAPSAVSAQSPTTALLLAAANGSETELDTDTELEGEDELKAGDEAAHSVATKNSHCDTASQDSMSFPAVVAVIERENSQNSAVGDTSAIESNSPHIAFLDQHATSLEPKSFETLEQDQQVALLTRIEPAWHSTESAMESSQLALPFDCSEAELSAVSTASVVPKDDDYAGDSNCESDGLDSDMPGAIELAMRLINEVLISNIFNHF
jgi:hypothetical protein